MHIEISAGGLTGMTAVDSFLSDFDSYIARADDVIASFATVKSSIGNLNGGIGTLQDAWSQIDARVQLEQQRKSDAEKIRTKAEDFADLAVRVDQEVAELVQQNKNEFYRVNPWLRPSGEEDKAWYEKIWDWLCDTGRDILKGAAAVGAAIAEGIKWVGDSVAKLWNELVEIYNSHGLLWKTLNIFGKLLECVAVVVACIISTACPVVLALMIIYAANTIINDCVDIYQIAQGNADEVGQYNALRTLLTETFGGLGEAIGGEKGQSLGVVIGNVLYFSGQIVTIVQDIREFSTGMSEIAGKTISTSGLFSEADGAAGGLWNLAARTDLTKITTQFAQWAKDFPNAAGLIKSIKLAYDAVDFSMDFITDLGDFTDSLQMTAFDLPDSFTELVLGGDNFFVVTDFDDLTALFQITELF